MKKQPHDHSTSPMRARCMVVDITATCHIMVREGATPRDSLGFTVV